jgi:hypothetical protein
MGDGYCGYCLKYTDDCCQFRENYDNTRPGKEWKLFLAFEAIIFRLR